MGMSDFYKMGEASEEESLATIARAEELGVTLLDTADIYGQGKNEQLISKAIRGSKRNDYQIATKFACFISPKGEFSIRCEPYYVREAIDKSLKCLETDHVDLYYMHRMDPNTPIQDTVKAMSELVKEGKVKYLGLSEVSADALRKAHSVHPITAVQLEWSLWTREAEKDVIPVCRELGIAIVAYSPLGRGFLTGQIKSIDDLPEDDFRRQNPRFSPENFSKNMELVDKVKDIAKRHDATPGQIALAWLHAQGDDVFPIPGTKRVNRLEENVTAFQIKLTRADLDELDAAFPHDVALGDRYQAEHMAIAHKSS